MVKRLTNEVKNGLYNKPEKHQLYEHQQRQNPVTYSVKLPKRPSMNDKFLKRELDDKTQNGQNPKYENGCPHLSLHQRLALVHRLYPTGVLQNRNDTSQLPNQAQVYEPSNIRHP
ncbi:hypothetical protein PanWU01x14_149760 [Parasponia andersonii]|uniref:Uncharacterized protein n=1 Tax=Parasponia andersonii TaxID=3476 RepID=A0A2P5CIH5_PARAD|nr:hypothetical protein PanWU01x14_149760 [Parasponia andersonii]